MSLDAESRAVLDYIRARETVPLHTLTPEAARVLPRLPLQPGPAVHRVKDSSVPGPVGSIPVRIYTPREGGPFPVLMWFFGGGWVLGSIEMADATCRKLALQTDCLVVSVGYRRPPEAKFPAAVEDCYSATLWVQQHAQELNGLPDCIAVGGESAGGNLAAAVALMSRDRGAPSLTAQLLVCPVMARDFSWPSYYELGADARPSVDLMTWFWDLYLRVGADARNPYAAPLVAENLADLPPAIILTAGCDTLRDEGEAYAKRLQESGVAVLYECFPGTIHLLFLLADNLPKGRQAIADASQALRSHFANRVRSPVNVNR